MENKLKITITSFLNRFIKAEFGHILIQNYLINHIFFIIFSFTIIFTIREEMTNSVIIFNQIGVYSSITGLFVGTYLVVIILNKKRNQNISRKYFVRFEYLRNLTWFLQSCHVHCNFVLDNRYSNNETDEKMSEFNKLNFNEMKERLWFLVIIKEDIPPELVNQILLMLDQSTKLFTSMYIKGYEKDLVNNFVIEPNERILAHSFFKKDFDESLKKVYDYCIKDLDSIKVLFI